MYSHIVLDGVVLDVKTRSTISICFRHSHPRMKLIPGNQ